ncbi:MAG: rod shape-determining protein [Clostridiales bacterium]|nr:rod shape-determining protein [Clostridiales bacterium]
MGKSHFGIDLGSYDIKVYDPELDEFSVLKNAIAIRNKTEIYAVGDEAYSMYERTPSNIKVLFPMNKGVISDYNAMQALLHELLSSGKQTLRRSAYYLMAVPTDLTEVEKRALYNLLVRSEARAREVMAVPSCIADGIGMGLDPYSEKAQYIINIGSGSTVYSVISSGGIVISRMIKKGGKDLDEAIGNYIRKEYNFKLGIFACEQLKNGLGSVYGIENNNMMVTGRNLVTGLPGEIRVSAHEVYTAMRPIIDEIIDMALSVLKKLPQEMADTVYDDGLYLTGGTADLNNLDLLIEKELNIPVHVAKDPRLSKVKGLSRIMNQPEFHRLTYSMQEEKHRWI